MKPGLVTEQRIEPIPKESYLAVYRPHSHTRGKEASENWSAQLTRPESDREFELEDLVGILFCILFIMRVVIFKI